MRTHFVTPRRETCRKISALALVALVSSATSAVAVPIDTSFVDNGSTDADINGTLPEHAESLTVATFNDHPEAFASHEHPDAHGHEHEAPLAGANGGAQPMVTIPTTRIADTRDGVGADARLADNDVATVQVTGTIDTSAAGQTEQREVIPQGADAVVLNVTAVSAADDGFFTLWPAGTEQPDTSNINFRRGETVANGATVPLSSDGKLSVFARGGGDLLLDVSGYYLDGAYTPMAATRLFDSRADDAALAAGSITHIATGATEGDLVSLNLTTDYSAAPGYFTVWSTPEGEGDTFEGSPATSNLNYAPGMIVANTVQAKVGAGGLISVYSHADASLIVDQTHHVPATSAASEAIIFDEAIRTYDSREDDRVWPAVVDMPRFWFGTDTQLADTGEAPGGPMDNAQAVVLNATVTNAAADGYATISQFIEAEGGQATSTINYRAGETRANRVIVPLDLVGRISAYTHNSADLVVDVVGYIPKAPAAPADVNLDYSSNELATKFVGEGIVDLYDREFLQFNANDPDGNGVKDWVVSGDVAKLSHWPVDSVVNLPIVAGPTYNGAPTVRVQHAGTPRQWSETEAKGSADHADPRTIITTIDMPLRHDVTGERGSMSFSAMSHFAGHAISTSDIDPLDPGSSVVLAVPTSRVLVEVLHDGELIGVDGHEATINVTLPQEFVDRATGGIVVSTLDMMDAAGADHFEFGVLTEDADGNNTVSVTLPAVSNFYHRGGMESQVGNPEIALTVEAANGDDITALLVLNVARK